MPYFSNVQTDNARDAIIAAHEGFSVNSSDMISQQSIYSMDKDTLKLRVAVLDALGLESSHLKGYQKKSGDHGIRANESFKGCSKPLISDATFEQARLLRAISDIDIVTRAWVDAVYLTKNDKELFRLMNKVYLHSYKVRAGTEQKVLFVVKLGIQQAVSKALDRPILTDSAIARVLGMSRSSYICSWKRKLENITDTINLLDEIFLERICVELGYSAFSGFEVLII